MTDRDLNLWLPWQTQDDKPYRVPMGFSGHTAGATVAMNLLWGLHGSQSAGKTLDGVVRTITQNIAPINSPVPLIDDEGLNGIDKALSLFTPAVLRPVVQHATGTDYLGNSLSGVGHRGYNLAHALGSSRSQMGGAAERITRGLVGAGFEPNVELVDNYLRQYGPAIYPIMEWMADMGTWYAGGDIEAVDALVPLQGFRGYNNDPVERRHWKRANRADSILQSYNEWTERQGFTHQEAMEMMGLTERELQAATQYESLAGQIRERAGQAKNVRQEFGAGIEDRQTRSRAIDKEVRGYMRQADLLYSNQFPDF